VGKQGGSWREKFEYGRRGGSVKVEGMEEIRKYWRTEKDYSFEDRLSLSISIRLS